MTLLASLGLALAQSASSGQSLGLSGGAVNIDFDLSFVAQMVVFAALILLLKPLLFDPVLALFAEREKRTDGAKAAAREMQEKAGEILRKYEHELEKVSRVAAEERDKARAETARLEAQELAQARAISTKIVEEGRSKIAEEIHAIQFDLGRQAEKLAKDIASRVLGREVA
ncbi:MAG TPA: H(+)-transporting ATPase [Polyangiaceae bacterium]|nr:H(+)-transporting ATPase [Polyangiaceae bacterium]